MKPWRRRDKFFDEFFRDFEKEFEGIGDDLIRIVEELKERSKEPGKGKPIIYGFSMRVGPEGEPMIERFGNTPAEYNEPKVTDEREPLVDVIEKDKEITVVAELPGIEKEDISLEVSDDILGIDVNTIARKYHKELKLPCKVKSDTTRAIYKNGVLEVKLERTEKKKERTSRVRVE